MKQIYVHGLGQTPANWEKTISQVKNSGESICPDLAEILQNKEVNYKNLYGAFSEICNESEEQINLCGLSLGAVLALNYAAEHPEKVNSLVLIAVQYKMPEKMLRFQNIIFRFLPGTMFQQMGFGKADFIKLCGSMMKLNFSKSLHKITCPVLIVCGEKDSANKKASIELTDMLENAELHTVPGAGHEVNMDAPKQLAKLLDDFWDKYAK